MSDPVSEHAHYVLAADSRTPAGLFLIQQGRLELPGFVGVIWRRAKPATVESRGPAGTAGTRLRRAIAHALASLVILL